MAKRVLFVLIVIVAMLSIQGCNKTWSVVLNSQNSLNGWEIQDLASPYETFIFQDGLYVDGDVVHAPFGFEGDFTMEIVFDLHLDSSVLPMLQFLFSGGEDAFFSKFVASTFVDINNSTENYYIAENPPYVALSYGNMIPGLNLDGTNTYKFVKTGSHVIVYMGDQIICDNTLTSYPYTVFFPSIYVDAASQAQIRIKSIKVVYDGDTTVYPRP